MHHQDRESEHSCEPMKHNARRCESTYDAVGATQRSPHLNAPRTKGLPLERPAAEHANPDVRAVGKRRAHVHKRAKPVDTVDRGRFGEAAPEFGDDHRKRVEDLDCLHHVNRW